MADVFDVRTTWVAGKLRVTIKNGTVAFVDKLDPASAIARTRMLKAALEQVPDVDIAEVERHVLQKAGEEPPAEESDAPSIVDEDPDPWPTPVDGADLLRDTAAMLTRHVVLPDHGAVTAALWALTTHAYDRFPWSPRLLFSSAVMRSGKTLALRLVGSVVARPLPVEGISGSALFRVIEKARPTMLLDEADTFLVARRDASEFGELLRGVVNSGYHRGGRQVRCVGDDHEPTAFSTFAPVGLAMIGEPPATVLDRSIVLRMRRRAEGEHVERIPPGVPLREQHVDLTRRCRRWAADHGDALADAVPAVPASLNDRQADCWWPLLAMADAAGGDWPAIARAAAVALSTAEPDEEQAAIRLLRDLREVFVAEERLVTAEVLRLLLAVDSAPWASWHGGQPLRADALARLLRPFGVRPVKWRGQTGTARGYQAADLRDPWARYLPAQPPAEAATPATPPQPAPLLGCSVAGRDMEPATPATASTSVAGVAGCGDLWRPPSTSPNHLPAKPVAGVAGDLRQGAEGDTTNTAPASDADVAEFDRLLAEQATRHEGRR